MLLGFLAMKTDRPQAYRPGGASAQNLQAGSGPPAGVYRLTGQAHFKIFSGAGEQAACEATGAHLYYGAYGGKIGPEEIEQVARYL